MQKLTTWKICENIQNFLAACASRNFGRIFFVCHYKGHSRSCEFQFQTLFIATVMLIDMSQVPEELWLSIRYHETEFIFSMDVRLDKSREEYE